MVSANNSFNEQKTPVEEISVPINEVIAAGDTESDDDDNTHNGYEPLPMDETQERDHSDEEADNAPLSRNSPSIESAEAALVRQVWSETKSLDIEMDSDKIDEVKRVMLNVTLGESNIPEWANRIPEDQWKQEFMEKLRNSAK